MALTLNILTLIGMVLGGALVHEAICNGYWNMFGPGTPSARQRQRWAAARQAARASRRRTRRSAPPSAPRPRTAPGPRRAGRPASQRATLSAR